MFGLFTKRISERPFGLVSVLFLQRPMHGLKKELTNIPTIILRAKNVPFQRFILLLTLDKEQETLIFTLIKFYNIEQTLRIWITTLKYYYIVYNIFKTKKYKIFK